MTDIQKDVTEIKVMCARIEERIVPLHETIKEHTTTLKDLNDRLIKQERKVYWLFGMIPASHGLLESFKRLF